MAHFSMEDWFLKNLVCPLSGSSLSFDGKHLRSEEGKRYPVVDGVPVLLRKGIPQTMPLADTSLKLAEDYVQGKAADPYFVASLGIDEGEKQELKSILRNPTAAGLKIDPVAYFMLAATCGLMYKKLSHTVHQYPIPELLLPQGEGKTLLDVGCNWGRWTVAAAYRGYDAVGVDPSLGAVMAARRVTRQMGLKARYVVADARFMPFRDGFFDQVFSYSVLQHFSRDDFMAALKCISRVLKLGGSSLIQMAHKFGVRSLYHQMRRYPKHAADFDVRYWSIAFLEKAFSDAIGPSQSSVEGFFGLGMQPGDIGMMPFWKKGVILASEALKKLSTIVKPMKYLADSIYIESRK